MPHTRKVLPKTKRIRVVVTTEDGVVLDSIYLTITEPSDRLEVRLLAVGKHQIVDNDILQLGTID